MLCPRHHRPHPRLLGDPAQLGALDRPLRAPRATACSRPPTPASRSRSRRSTPTRRRSRRSRSPRSSSTSRRVVARARRAADPHRPLRRRRVHPDPARPRLRRRRAWRSTRRRPRACRSCPLSQVKATFPVLKNPANRHKAVGFTLEQWHYAFTNTFSEEESRALYERYHIPASGRIFWDSALANLQPGHQDTWVDYHNDDRAPLLFISGSEDHLMPPDGPAVERQALQGRATVTEVKEFEGAAPAAGARPAGRRSPTTRWTGRWRTPCGRARVTERPHHPHRRADRADRGRRLAAADRPDLRPARPAVPLRLGHRRRASWPARRSRPPTCGPIDAVLLTHDHHLNRLRHLVDRRHAVDGLQLADASRNRRDTGAVCSR